MLHPVIEHLQQRMNVNQALFTGKEEGGTVYYLLQQHLPGSILIVPKQGTPTIFVPGFEYDRFKNTLKGVKVKRADSLKKIFSMLKGSTGYHGTEASARLYMELRKHHPKDIAEDIGKLRAIKTPLEIAKLTTAADITVRIYQKLFKQHFTHEQEIKDFLFMETLKEHCKPAFEPIVASGADAALPHYEGAKTLARGFCVIDYGVMYKGYRADVTRTIFIGKPTRQEKQRYQQLYDIQQEAITHYKAGTPCKDAHNFVAKKLGKLLIHSLGHGIGIDVHENPIISVRSTHTFQNTMTVTCEPGMYKTGEYGMRIEDDILIQDDTPIVLTKALTSKLICWAKHI